MSTITGWPQSAALAVIPKITATLSMIGSSCIVWEVLGDRKQSKSETMNRILIAMSASDLLMGFAWFLSTWPVPASESSLAFSLGNTQTCTMQGVLFLFGNTTSAMYNAALSLCYMLRIRMRWKDLQLQAAERFIHAIILTITTGATATSIGLKLMNSQLNICRIVASPFGCVQTFESLINKEAQPSCTRGDNATLYSYSLSTIWIWASFAVVVASMLIMCAHVRNVERNSIMYQKRGSVMFMRNYNKDKKSRRKAIAAKLKRSKAIVKQATWFICAFLVTQIPDTIYKAILDSSGVIYFWALLLVNILLSSRGLVNFIVFDRTRTQMISPVSRALRYICFCNGWAREQLHFTETVQNFTDLLSTSMTSGRMAIRGLSGSLHGMLGSWHGSWQHRREELPHDLLAASRSRESSRKMSLKRLLSSSLHGSNHGSQARGGMDAILRGNPQSPDEQTEIKRSSAPSTMLRRTQMLESIPSQSMLNIIPNTEVNGTPDLEQGLRTRRARRFGTTRRSSAALYDRFPISEALLRAVHDEEEDEEEEQKEELLQYLANKEETITRTPAHNSRSDTGINISQPAAAEATVYNTTHLNLYNLTTIGPCSIQPISHGTKAMEKPPMRRYSI